MMKLYCVKIVVFVPRTHADGVREAMGDAGAGRMGHYSHCSYSSVGIGRYRPLKGAHPFIGEVGKPTDVEEERMEFVCERSKVRGVISAMREVHPYEEPAFDIYPVLRENEL